METRWIKQGDLPNLTARINAQRVGNLTDCTVAMRMRNQETDAWITRSCTVTDAANGDVEYQLVAGETDVPGTYWVEFWITVPNVGTRIAPGNTFLNLSIMEHIGT